MSSLPVADTPFVSASVATLVKAIGLALEAHPSAEAASPGITAAVKLAVADPELIPESKLVTSTEHYTQQLLHVDPAGRFSVVLLTWLPGQQTLIHDHRCWCCFGVWRGEETERAYEASDGGLVPGGLTVNRAGDCEFLLPPGDIHSVINSGDELAVSLHVYGADLRQHGTSIRRRYPAPAVPRPAVSPEEIAAVIGGGFSGTMIAARLLRQGKRVVMIEPDEPGRGVAYGTRCQQHLLNVPAAGMSAWPEDPGHFVRWAGSRGLLRTDHDFLPRKIYGEYLAEILHREVHASEGRFEHVRGKAVAVEAGEGVDVTLAGGQRLFFDLGVLAVGFPTPSRPFDPKSEAWDSPGVIDVNQQHGALASIGHRDPVIVLGAGLTMLDTVATLHAQGHEGEILVLSRHGLLPAAHELEKIRGGFDAEAFRSRLTGGPPTTRRLLREVRVTARHADREGLCWQEVINAIRPLTTSLWQSLPPEERRRFVRRVRPYWEVARHRASPATIEPFRLGLEAGRIIRRTGTPWKIEDDGESGIRIHMRTRRGVETVVEGRWLLNCTGFTANWAESRDPLMRSLLERGQIQQDALGLGLETSADCQLIGADGVVSPRLYYAGPALRARDWECTAVPELREIARRIAASIGTAPARNGLPG